MTYREQAYLDRCYCDAPSTMHCSVCNRPRCAQHAGDDDLCHRCEEAIGHEMNGRATRRIGSAAALGACTFLGAMVAHVALIAMPVAFAVFGTTYLGHRSIQERRVRRALGPRLATSTGEVAPPVDYDAPRFPSPGGSGMSRGTGRLDEV